MRHPATRPPATVTPTCPNRVTWCTAHEHDGEGHIHAITPVTVTAGTISMHQIADGVVFDPQDEPMVWFDDVPMTIAAAAEVAAVLSGLVAAALAPNPVHGPAVSVTMNA